MVLSLICKYISLFIYIYYSYVNECEYSHMNDDLYKNSFENKRRYSRNILRATTKKLKHLILRIITVS